MATFYVARSEIITPLPWQTFALPFSDNWSRGIGDRFTFVLQHLRQLKQVHTLTHPAKMGARGTGEDVVEDGD